MNGRPRRLPRGPSSSLLPVSLRAPPGSLGVRLLQRQVRSGSLYGRGNAGSPSDGKPSKRCATLDVRGDCAMDGKPLPISPDDLYDRLGTAAAPLVIDVRRPEAFRDD